MRELSWKPEQCAELSVMGDVVRSGTARIMELRGKDLRVATEPAVENGAAVRLEWEGQLVLGEVRHAAPGGFWMEIQHMILDTAEPLWQRQGWQRR